VVILSERLEAKARALRESHARHRVVMVSGNFNLVHPGHIRLLNFARSCGDALVVALHDDGEPGVAVQRELRQEGLASMVAVDHVVTLRHQELTAFILALQPHVVVKGNEHERGINPEKDVVRSYGGHLIFSSGDARFSYMDVIRQERDDPFRPRLRRASEFCDKHGLTFLRLQELVNAFAGKRMLVVGDLIMDEYIHCEALGMSQEDPTIVVTPVESQRYVGGAGIVAAHLVGLGAQARFLTICGDDDVADAASASLKNLRVQHSIVRDGSRPTILKQRFRAAGKTLLRVSHLRSHDAGEEYIEQMFEKVEQQLHQTDLLVFSDFNYGCLPQAFVDRVSRLCLDSKIPFVADSQASSQVGDVSRFKQAALITATEREARLAVNDFKSGLQNVADRLVGKSGAHALIIKLGQEGCVIVKPEPQLETSNLHALNRNPVDVAGAGDALLAAASLALVAGGNIWECAYLGSVAAALQVSRMGNVPLQFVELVNELNCRETRIRDN
jgi:rfaE bifunctional protein kinase chain/domain